jgi:formylglycine-generating enzyme
MTLLPEGYCIDNTELTRAEYQAWLDGIGDPSTVQQSAECSAWNNAFVPDATCMSGTTVCQGSGCANHPMCCVDWCDAKAYCQAVGKRLCGKITGGMNAMADHHDATLSQWFNACSAHAQSLYPYGGSDETDCNVVESQRNTTIPVGSLATCQSKAPGYSGIYDMNGNVGEWEDSCDGTGPTSRCLVRGGSFGSYYSSCTADVNIAKTSATSSVGIRCCYP